jgi:hypothetical protein
MSRAAWLSAAATLCVLSIAGCGSHGVRSASADYIPWLPLKATGQYPQAPSPTPTAPVAIPSGTPVCPAGQLQAAGGGGGGATGHTNAPVTFRNDSSRDCYLQGYPDIRIFDSGGRLLAQAVGSANRGTFFEDEPAFQVLMVAGTARLSSTEPAPRGQAFMNIEWFECRGARASSLSIDMPDGGGSLTIPYSVSSGYSPICDSTGSHPTGGLTRGPLSPAGYQWPPDPTYLTVGISISAPASVKRGTTLVYYVTLHNASQTDYRLDPCPDYVELMRFKKPVADYQLNCVPIGHIAAGASAKFEMRMVIPSDVSPGPNDLTWALTDGRLALPYADTAIDIT